jgi:CYTH domain-containing protein
MGDEMQEGLAMGTEVERKFLVVGKAWKTAPGSLVRQGYLNRDPKRTVRIRVDGEKAWITVKGITIGATRSEFEYRIPRKDADALLQLCEAPLVEKTRRRIKHAGHLWEVDEFYGDNAGLVVAEVELKHECDPVKLPPWIGAEVTHDPRYFNSNLVQHPYRQWPAQNPRKARPKQRAPKAPK